MFTLRHRPAPPNQLGGVRLIERLAAGSSAEVWRGELEASGATVAVKLFDARGRVARRLDREVGMLASLDHAHVVWICDHGVHSPDNRVWFAMEYASGGTLRSHREPTSWDEARGVLAQLLRGLAHAHSRGILHLDVKPSNVLFGARDRVLLSDFGVGVGRGERVGQIVGSPGYMAPERFEPDGDLGPWTDLYALGCVAWEMCCGGRPFPERDWMLLAHAHTHRRLPPLSPVWAVPAGVESWLASLLNKRISGRYGHAADALSDLEKLGPLPPVVAVRRDEPASLELRPLRTANLIGRDGDREVLGAALGRVSTNRSPEAVVIRGAAGVGKSRLAGWFAETVDESGAALSLKAAFSAIPAAGDGIAGMTRSWFRCGELTGDALRERVGKVVRQRWTHGVASLEAAALELLGEDAGDGRGRYRSLERLLVEQDRPVVLWLDDVQWGPDALGFALHALGLDDLPVLLLLVIRDEALAGHPVVACKVRDLSELDAVTTLELEALPNAFHGDLVRAILPLERQLAKEVAAHTAGHPLFAAQLLRDWIDRRALVAGDGGFRLAVREELPATLADLWRRRLDDLIGSNADAGHALELAATLGLVVDRGEWGAVCEAVGLEVPDTLVDQLVSRRMAVISPQEQDRWAFVHGLLNDALRARAISRQVDHHRACAEMLLGRGRKYAARAGMHLEAGGAWDACLVPLMHGLRDAIETTELPVANDLVYRLLENFGRAEVATDDPRWGRLWALRSILAQSQGEFAEALAFIERAAAGAGEHGWSMPQIDLTTAGLHMIRGDIEGAMRSFGAVISATTPGERMHRRASIGLAMSEIRMGHLERGARYLRKVLATCTADADQLMAMRCWFGIANVSVQLGDLAGAEHAVEQAAVAARVAGSKRGVAECDNYSGEICRRRGDLVGAEAHYRRAWRNLDVLDREESVVARTNLASALLEQGRIDGARVHYEVVLTRISDGSAFLQIACHAGLLACSAGVDSWDEHLRLVRERVESSGYVEHDIVELVQLASTLAAKNGHPERATAADDLARELRARLH